MIYLLLVAVLLITVWNIIISSYDFFNPTVIFCVINLVYSTVAAIIINAYDIQFHFQTVAVLVSGLLIFTVVNMLRGLFGKVVVRSRYYSSLPLCRYNIRTEWILIFVLFEIVVAFFMVKYARDVAHYFYGTSSKLTDILGNYNRAIKTRGEELSTSGVHASIVYSLGWPICIAFNTLLSVVAIIDYEYTRKISFKYLLPYSILVVMSFLNASRSTAFRFMTQIAAEYVIIHRWHQGSVRRGNLRMLIKLITYGSLVIIALAYTINFLGRSTSLPLFEYATAYVGGPFINLDIGIERDIGYSTIFAQETLHHFYSFIGGRLKIPALVYNLHIPYNFIKGHYLGNVYTMYYMFIEDFGYLGIFPFTFVVALFYNVNYYRLNKLSETRSCFSFRLLIFGYLFNDLLMLTFSNRFYETAFGRQAILFYFFMFIIWYLFRKGLFSEGLFSVRLRIGK